MSAGTLRDFFNMQSKTGLTPDRKAQIFANIQGQIKPTTRQTTSFSNMRSSWYFKTATTAALAFTLIYILYTPISGPLFQTKDNVLIARQGNVAQAGYVGDILATQGEINIVRNGISTKTSKLQWGDIVYLYNTSKADFTLRDGSHGVVEWPAQLTIVEHADSGLILSVDHARYMQIDKDNSINSTTTTTSEELVIETSTSRITTDKDDKVQLALVTTQERQFIQNKGDSVTIESIVPDTASPVTQQLASSHVAEVTDSVKVYDQIAMIYDELKTQSTSQTYDLTQGELATDDIKSLLALNQTPTSDVVGPVQIAYTAPETSAIQTTNTQSDIEPREIASDNITAPDKLVAMMSDNIAESNQDNAAMLSRSDTATIWWLLSPEETAHSDTAATKNKTTETDQIDTVEAIDEPITTSIKSPLSNQQIHSIMKHEWETCIQDNDLQQIQRAFDIADGTSLTDTIVSIRSSLYLTEYLESILSSLSICSDDQD
jgi:hypothetical protein